MDMLGEPLDDGGVRALLHGDFSQDGWIEGGRFGVETFCLGQVAIARGTSCRAKKSCAALRIRRATSPRSFDTERVPRGLV